MSLVLVGTDRKEYYPKEIWIDTDDLDQKEYYYFRKAEELGLIPLSRQILRGKLTGNMIENNREKYHKLFEERET